jgi:hypothetical protein
MSYFESFIGEVGEAGREYVIKREGDKKALEGN